MGREDSKSLSETAQCITGRVGAEVFMLQVHPSTPQTSAATPPITFQDTEPALQLQRLKYLR